MVSWVHMKNLYYLAGKLGAVLLALTMIGSPALASADTISDLQAQINALYAQISALQAKLQSAQPTASFCLTVAGDLKIGDKGDAVKNLQEALQKLSYFNGAIDGVFGESTASALTAFQEANRAEILTPNGLSHGTGYFGASSRRVLMLRFPCSGVTTTDLKSDAASTRGALEIKYPTGGETLKAGSTYTLQWKGYDAGGTSYQVSLVKRGVNGGDDIIQSIGKIYNSIYSPDPKLVWKIPTNVAAGSGYRISYVGSDAGGKGGGASNSFSISSSVTAAVRISEVWAKGWDEGTVTANESVTVSGKGFLPTGNNVVITRAINAAGFDEMVLSNQLSDGTSITFTFPNIGATTYKLRVENANGTSNSRTITVKNPYVDTDTSIDAEIESGSEILSFTTSGDGTGHSTTLTWKASAATDASIDFECSIGSIQFYTKGDNRTVGCEKGGLVTYTGSSGNSITILGQNNTSALTVPFTLTLLKNGSPTGEKKTVSVKFAAVETKVTETTAVTEPVTVPFQMTYPTRGSILKNYSTYKLQWKGSDPGVTSYQVSLVKDFGMGDTVLRSIGTVTTAQPWLSWTVPLNLAAGPGYKIAYTGTNIYGEKVSGVSGEFSVTQSSLFGY